MSPSPERGRAASSAGLLLRDVTEADLPVFFEHQRDPEANRMALYPAKDRATFDADWKRVLTNEDLVKKTILFEGRIAGNVVSFERDGKREVGYWIGREFWGRGLATQALAELLQEVTVRPLYAHVATSNVPSIRVLEKCGFSVSVRQRVFDERLGEEVEEVVLKLV